CPHCKAVGTLIRHGYLRGFDEGNSQRKTIRARRIFCSNRNARPGCGRTFSVWAAAKIRRRSVTTGALGRLLLSAVAASLAAAIQHSRRTLPRSLVVPPHRTLPTPSRLLTEFSSRHVADDQRELVLTDRQLQMSPLAAPAFASLSFALRPLVP